MKYTIIAIGLSLNIASATSVTVSNNRGPLNTREVLDNTGAPIGGGFASVGVIANESAIEGLRTGSSSFADLMYTQFGNAAGALDAQGRITPSITDNVNIDSAEGAPFRSQSIYLVVVNNDDFSLADQAFIYRFDTAYGDADSGAPINLTLTAADSSGSTLYGTENLTGAVGSQNFQLESLVPIPEPSTGLLAALAGLGLISRRRR